jgi:hypothetical protein
LAELNGRLAVLKAARNERWDAEWKDCEEKLREVTAAG